MRHPVISVDLNYIVSHDLNWDAFSGKTVVISGANGFLPAYIVETLLHLNKNLERAATKVIGVVRNRDKALTRFKAYIDRPDLELIVQDICSPLAVKGDVDFIIHAASQASPKFYGVDPIGTLSANIFGTHNLLELARVKQVQSFLYFSSGEVYGEVSSEQIPNSEDIYGHLDPLSVRSCYAESKRMGENMCICWHHQFGVPVKIVRPFHTYGPGMNLDDGRVFADFVADIVNGRDIRMQSDGSATRAFCYLADATVGFLQVLLHGENGEAYNVGNDEGEISILDLANLLVDIFPEKSLQVIRNGLPQQVGYLPNRISRACPDITKIRKLGWKPQIGLKEGFLRTIRSFQQ